MKRGMHWQDVLLLLAGIYSFLSPIWTATTTKATTTMIVLGIVTALAALAELVRADIMSLEGLTMVLGVLFFISPWVMGFSDLRAMSWTAWVVGVVTFAIGAADVQVTRMHHRDTMAASH